VPPSDVAPLSHSLQGVILREARNLALIFVGSSNLWQSEIPRFARNDSVFTRTHEGVE
jgi:hypothetical protein